MKIRRIPQSTAQTISTSQLLKATRVHLDQSRSSGLPPRCVKKEKGSARHQNVCLYRCPSEESRLRSPDLQPELAVKRKKKALTIEGQKQLLTASSSGAHAIAYGCAIYVLCKKKTSSMLKNQM